MKDSSRSILSTRDISIVGHQIKSLRCNPTTYLSFGDNLICFLILYHALYEEVTSSKPLDVISYWLATIVMEGKQEHSFFLMMWSKWLFLFTRRAQHRLKKASCNLFGSHSTKIFLNILYPSPMSIESLTIS